jgi:hypothetical protein
MLRVIERASQSDAGSYTECNAKRDVANEDANNGAHAGTDRDTERQPLVLIHDLAFLTVHRTSYRRRNPSSAIQARARRDDIGVNHIPPRKNYGSIFREHSRTLAQARLDGTRGSAHPAKCARPDRSHLSRRTVRSRRGSGDEIAVRRGDCRA